MLFCNLYPDNIDKILEQNFERKKEFEKREISRYENNVIVYRGSEIIVYSSRNEYIVDSLSMILDNPLKRIHLHTFEYSSTVKEATVAQCSEFEAFVSEFPAIEFTLIKIFIQNKHVGNIFLWENKESEFALREILNKYSVIEVEGKNSSSIVKLLIKAEKI